MATNMANIGHTRSKSLRIPATESFLKRPAPAAPSSSSSSSVQTKDGRHNGPSHLALFLRNLRLLEFDLREDWPDITAETFSTKDNQQNIKKRIQSVEWTLYQLFCLWDPQDAREKLAPFFPPFEPLQSINLRAALYRCLDHLKKNGILGRDAVLRKTMLDECKGERLEEVLSVFSTAVLKRLVQDDGGHDAVAQQLALEKFHYTSVPTEDLSVLVLAHQVSLRRILERKLEAKSHYNGFAELLREKDEKLAQRKEELERAIEEDESTEFVSRAEIAALQDRVRKNWYGNNGWLESVTHGDGPAEDGGLLSQPFDKVWKNAEAGNLEEIEGGRRKGLLEQLDARVQEQNSRLKKWMSFGEQMSASRKGERKEEKKEKKVPASLDLGLGAHEALQLNAAAKEEQKSWCPKKENATLLDKLRQDLANVCKPKRVASPAKRHVPVYEEHVSTSRSPEPAYQGNNTPRKQEWAPGAQNNTPRGQEWEFQTRNGRESVDLGVSRSRSPGVQAEAEQEDEDVDMGDAEPMQQDEDEDSYEETNHADAMDVDERLASETEAEQPSQEFMAPPPPSSRLRNSPAPSRIENDIDYSSMAPPPASSRLHSSPSPYAAPKMAHHASMEPSPAVSRLRGSPSPYAATNMDVEVSMPPLSVPQSLRRNTQSKSDLQARLRSSTRKPSAKKANASSAVAEVPLPQSPDLTTKILNSMDPASPSPVKCYQSLPLAERTRQTMASSSNEPSFSVHRNSTKQFDEDDDDLEQFTPRPALSHGSSATNTDPSTITRSMSLVDRTRLNMSSLRTSTTKLPASEQEEMDDLMTFTPRPTLASTPAQPMTLTERTKLSMNNVRPKSTIKKSRQSIANLEEYDELQFVATPPRNPQIRLSSVPYIDGMAEEEPDFAAAEDAAHKVEANRKSEGLIERTRQSMKDLELVSERARMERKRSVKVAAKKKRESFMPKRESAYEEEDTLRLIENAEEVDYEDAFRSRPKIKMSPNVSPVKGGWREGSVSPFPM